MANVCISLVVFGNVTVGCLNYAVWCILTEWFDVGYFMLAYVIAYM